MYVYICMYDHHDSAKASQTHDFEHNLSLMMLKGLQIIQLSDKNNSPAFCKSSSSFPRLKAH